MQEFIGNSKLKSIEEKYISMLNNYCDVKDNKNDIINERIINFMDNDYKNIFEELLQSEQANQLLGK